MVFGQTWSCKGYTFGLRSLEKGAVFAKGFLISFRFVSIVPSSGTILTNHLSDSACSDLNMKLRMPELPHIK